MKSDSRAVSLVGQLTENDLLDFPFSRYLSLWVRDMNPTKVQITVNGKTLPLAAAGEAQGYDGWTHHLLTMPDEFRRGSFCSLRIDATITGQRPALDNLSLEAVAYVRTPYAVRDLQARKGKAGGTVDLSWTAPASPEGDRLAKYILTASETPTLEHGKVIEISPIQRAGGTEEQTILFESGKSYYLSLSAVDEYGHCAPPSPLVQTTANRGPVHRTAYDFETGGLEGFENGNPAWRLQVTHEPGKGNCLRVDFAKTAGWSFITFDVDPAMLSIHRYITMNVKGRVTLLGKLWCNDALQQDMEIQSSDSDSEWTTLKFDTRRADQIIPGRDRVEKILLFVQPGAWSGSGTFFVDDIQYSGK